MCMGHTSRMSVLVLPDIGKYSKYRKDAFLIFDTESLKLQSSKAQGSAIDDVTSANNNLVGRVKF